MRYPVFGKPPSEENMIYCIENGIINNRVMPIKHDNTLGDILFFQSDVFPIQLELEPNGGSWGEEFDSITYRVYEIPVDGNSFNHECEKQFNVTYNPNDSWNDAISGLIMELNGIFCNAVRKIDK